VIKRDKKICSFIFAYFIWRRDFISLERSEKFKLRILRDIFSVFIKHSAKMNRIAKIFWVFLVTLYLTFDNVESFEVHDKRNTENANGIEESCGIMSSSAGLVAGGKVSTQEQFPWIVAITLKLIYEWYHSGSGSLISDKHVVTSARTVSLSNSGESLKAVKNEIIQLYFGTTIWNGINEPGAIFINGADGIEKIVLYPGARAGDNLKEILSINNLAVVFLKNSIQFSKLISPVCLWKFDTKASEQVGQIAYGVGYGREKNQMVTGIRKYAQMTITDYDECKIKWNILIENDPTRDNFCAKGDDSNFAYCYDGPLYMKINGKWYLRGIMVGISNVSPRIMVYDDQSVKFVDWISSVTQQ
jgi:hypothetical protein